MGGGHYNTIRRAKATMQYSSQTVADIFKQHTTYSEMKPSFDMIRESRDSDEHPNSIPIIIGLDVTGSMGHIPHKLIQTGLPKLMGSVIQAGTPDPQLMFIAIGDHECDKEPLQVSQFESSDILIDEWLERIYLEGGGGGNTGESYMLAWYFAAQHTVTDHNKKRGEKGILVTIGDEPNLKRLPGNSLNKILNGGQAKDYTSTELFDMASETYNVYHIHINHGYRSEADTDWKQLLGDNLIIVKDIDNIPNIIAKLVLENKTIKSTLQIKNIKEETIQSEKEQEIL